jgi:acyl-CoA hydrolase/GNAT superfamily N-acetyltransferase
MGLKAALAAANWRANAISAAEAVAMVPASGHVFVSSACATPTTFLDALEDAALDHPGIRLQHFLTRAIDDHPRRPVVSHRTWFISRDMLPLLPAGRVDYAPLLLREVPRLLAMGRMSVDVAVVQVSEPDAGGMCSLGASVGLSRSMIAAAPVVIAEINAAMPRTRGDTLVPFDKFAAVIDVEPRMIEYQPRSDAGPMVEDEPRSDVGSVIEDIARYVARLVPNGATLQTGPGLVASEVLARLDSRQDLGVHSDVITDAVLDLVEAGVITGRQKSMSRGRVVASLAMGTQRLFDAIDGNKTYSFRPIDQISNPTIIAAQNRMVSITQAFAVDLTGQVCLESRDGVPYGGVGSAPAFHYGAARSRGGRAIVCVPSTDSHGRSTIRGVLEPGEAVTIPRYEAHWIITEYGSAFLYGMTTRERSAALLEIAHPDHRDALLEQAKDLGLLPSDQALRSRSAYPVSEERTVSLRDGTEVLMRPTRTTDDRLLQDLFYRLNPEDVRTRFFRNLSSMTRQMAQHLTSVSYDREMAFAAVVGEEENEQIVATSSYYLDPSTRLADVAYLVDPDWQGRGLGTALHDRTVQYAAAHGVRGFTADVLEDNKGMMEVFARGPGRVSVQTRQGVHEVSVLFGPLDAMDTDLQMSAT